MNLPSFLLETVYEFSPDVQAALASGKLHQVVTAAGQFLPIARDPATGRFVQIAKAGTRLAAQPLIAMADITSGAVETGILGFQIDRGFKRTYREIAAVQQGIKSLQAGMGVLQASTALIGVGVAATAVLSAVSLHQILKLRENVKQLGLEMKDGFVDLKTALQDQGNAVLQHIDKVANDLKFHSQKLLMIKAYGQFREAGRLIETALRCNDVSSRNDTLTTALNLLANALSVYNSAELFTDTNAAGSLRRMECIWGIEQMIALIYQLRGQSEAICDRLSQLRQRIQRDSLTVIDQCEWEEELDLLFPELLRIQQCDLPILQTWQEQIEWGQALSPEEQKQLASVEMQAEAEITAAHPHELVELPEQVLYDNLKQTSHFLSLRDQLRFIVKPELRQQYEGYIAERSRAAGYKALAPGNWQEVSDQTVANLYWHLKQTEYAA